MKVVLQANDHCKQVLKQSVYWGLTTFGFSTPDPPKTMGSTRVSKGYTQWAAQGQGIYRYSCRVRSAVNKNDDPGAHLGLLQFYQEEGNFMIDYHNLHG